MPSSALSLIEPLESRIAPATLIDAKTVTYTDIDGDAVIVKMSRPVFLSAAIADEILHFSTGSVNGSNAAGQQLQMIDLTGSGLSQSAGAQLRAVASGTSISVKAQPRLGFGNLTADVGYVRAALVDSARFDFFANIDLGKVTVDGDLGRIDAGDNISDTAVRAIRVGSMGKTSTQPAGNAGYQSNILGPVGSIHATGNIAGAFISVIGGQFGDIGRVTIDGALIGAAGDSSGQIAFTGHLGSFVAGGIVGGGGVQSGAVVGNLNNPDRPTSIGRVHVLGSVTGGAGTDSGEIAASRLPSVRIDGDVTGNAIGLRSAFIFGDKSVGHVEVAGSVRGGAQASGGIFSNGKIQDVRIGQDMVGGAGSSSGGIFANKINTVEIGRDLTGGANSQSGEISADDSIKKVIIGRDVTGGDGQFSGNIFAANTIGKVTIGGDLTGVGNLSGRISTTNLGQLSIVGSIVGGAGEDSGEVLAIKLGTIRVGGDVQGGGGDSSGSILAGQIADLEVSGSVFGAAGPNSGLIAGDAGVIFAKTNLITFGEILRLHIGQDVKGGAGNSSGNILTSGTLKTAEIDGDLIGGTVDSATALLNSGYIQARHIESLTVKNVTAGTNAGAGGIANSGAIRATQDIASLTVTGNVQGTAANNAIIAATGFGASRPANATTDVAIKSLVINGSVDRAEILAGYDTAATAANHRGALANGDAQISLVRVKTNLTASSIVAGASPGDAFFGNTGDAAGTGTSATILSKIAAVIVDGAAVGSGNGAESFGIVAQTVEAVVIGGVIQPLTAGQDDLAITANFHIREV